MVCAYTVLVTTYDASATFIATGSRKADASLKPGDIRTATYRIDSGYRPTHPKSSFPKMAETIEIATMQKAKAFWETDKKRRNAFTATHKGTALWTWDQLCNDEKGWTDFMMANLSDIYGALGAVLSEKNPSTGAMWHEFREYARMKVVMVLENKTFRVGSIGEFTDNPDLAGTMTIIDASLGKQASKLALKFTPSV